MENSMKKECKAVVYTRVASRMQTDQTNSCLDQQTQCEKYAEQQGIEITGYFGGFYDSTAEHKLDLQNMLNYLATKHPESPNVIVVNADRISRNSIEYRAFAEQLSKMGGSILLVSPSQIADFMNLINNIKK